MTEVREHRDKRGVREAAAPRWRSSCRAAAALLELRPHVGSPEAMGRFLYHFARAVT
jgi:hypothetical protein